MKRLVCDIDRCLACRSCELACSAAHAPPRAGETPQLPVPWIRVVRVDDKGILRHVRALALQCRHCQDPACVPACISGATRKEESGAVTLDPERCVGCWSCIMVCPVGAVARNPLAHRAAKCDLCPDAATPACVVACPTRALSLQETAP